MRTIATLVALLFAFPAEAIEAPKCGPFTVLLENLQIKSGGNDVGDIAVGHVTVFTEDGVEFGSQDVTTLVAPGLKEGDKQLILTAYLTVGDSQLIYSGSYPAPGQVDTVPHFDTELAVIGGTGAFKGATGQASFSTKDGKRQASFDIECPK